MLDGCCLQWRLGLGPRPRASRRDGLLDAHQQSMHALAESIWVSKLVTKVYDVV